MSVLFFVFFGFAVGFCPDAVAAAQAGEPVPAPAQPRRRPHSCRQDRKTSGYRTALILDPEIGPGLG